MVTTMQNEGATLIEWPQQRRNRQSQPVRVSHRLTDIPNTLLCDVEESNSFAAVVQSLVDAFNEKADPKTKLTELSVAIDNPDTFGDYDETVRQVVLALAGVSALRKMPTREMWEYLWSLAWHSGSLASFLPQAVVVAAKEEKFREQFLAVAHSVITEAVQNPGRRSIQRDKDVGKNRREHWQKHPQLLALWRGNFDHSSLAVGPDDDQILLTVAAIDIAEFVKLLALYDYPDPVAHALMWCGTPWSFERWRAVASIAPLAFGENAIWNGSLILPLLLGIARNQFQFGLGRQSTPDQVSEATSDIKTLASEVARTIASRADAVGCTTRWLNWLIRTAVPAISANQIPYPTDANSQGFIDDAIIEALIAEMPADRWNTDSASDAETWEPWCQFAAGALVALAGKTSMPSPTIFLDEWRCSIDEWPLRYSQGVKLRAIPFEGAGLRVDGYGARLLAIPLVEAAHADNLWRRFWASTAPLREIVEFGDAEETDNNGWQGRIDASHLLMLQFSIGLMMMDHLVMPPRPLNYDRLSAIAGLLPCLDEAVREMTAIDQLNAKFWSEAVRHLAIRRAKWLSDKSEPNSIALNAEAQPTLADFIRALAGDTENLLALAYAARQNGVDKTALAIAFKDANVDLGAEIDIATYLIEISPRAISLSEAQLDAAREILHCTPARTNAE
jgi:hypothetical protein